MLVSTWREKDGPMIENNNPIECKVEMPPVASEPSADQVRTYRSPELIVIGKAIALVRGGTGGAYLDGGGPYRNAP
jgi:hypothetical protein